MTLHSSQSDWYWVYYFYFALRINLQVVRIRPATPATFLGGLTEGFTLENDKVKIKEKEKVKSRPVK